MEERPYPRSAIWCVGEGYPLFCSNAKGGKCSDVSRMRRSRTTLASTEAAATDADRASPSMIGYTDPRNRAGAGPGRRDEVQRSVDEEGVGWAGQPGERPFRCEAERHAHAPAIALLGRGVAHRPIDAPGADALEDGFAPGFTELLRVPEPAGLCPLGRLGRDDGHTDGHRARPRTATDLVHACDTRVTAAAQRALFDQIRRADAGSRRTGHGRVAGINTMGA